MMTGTNLGEPWKCFWKITPVMFKSSHIWRLTWRLMKIWFCLQCHYHWSGSDDDTGSLSGIFWQVIIVFTSGSVLRPEPKLQTLSHVSLSFNLAHTFRQNINTINVVRHQYLKTYCVDSRPVFRTNAKEILGGTWSAHAHHKPTGERQSGNYSNLSV